MTRQRVGEANEASLCAVDELKWAGTARLTLRPRALGRLGLALCAEVGYSWHRAAGTYDTAVFSGRRLTPTTRPGAKAVLPGMPQPAPMPSALALTTDAAHLE